MNLPLPTPIPEPPEVVVADDDDESRGELVARLRAEGFRVAEVADGQQLTDRLLGTRALRPPPRVVIAEMFLPGANGLEVCGFAHDTGLSVRFILTTSVGSDELRDEARRAGAAAVFDRPVALDRIAAAVATILADSAD